jgi:3-dehydroquinate synthase
MTVEINFQESIAKNYTITIDRVPDIVLNTKVAIITNPTVSNLHLEYLKQNVHADELTVVTIPDGEEYKRLDTIKTILNHLFEHKLDRKSTLIALGGGVIGDMTGFTAAIYQRGINFIQVPTTLLSQVDASVGGKTGINNNFGKNLIGAFHQPSAVYIDPHFLTTLPQREFSAGVAEVIKMAVTFDKEFFEFLEEVDFKDHESLKSIIAKSVKTKADVVAQDEKEAGIRAALNYGHTFAHVIENQTAYKTYLHGEAVAIGICMANELSLALGLMTKKEVDRIKNLLTKHGLPVTYHIDDAEAFYDAFFLDKKTFNKKITFILANGIGDFVFKDDTDKAIVIDVIERFSHG